MNVRRLAFAAAFVIACQSSVPSLPSLLPNTDGTFVPAGAPLPALQASLTSDPTDADSYIPMVSPAGGAYLRRSTNSIVIRTPTPPQGPRRVGIQVGHWKTDEVPAELHKLVPQTGAIWDDVHEVDVNMDIGQRVAALLRKAGVTVDLLPTTVPPGYVADAFVALHADSDGIGELSGFKLAHGPLRGPFEDRLVDDIKQAYASALHMDYDASHVGVDMRFYYPFNWGRFQHATSAHTPAAILEMGYLSSDDDRAILTRQPDAVAAAIAAGLLRFLNETPRAAIFKDDIVVPLPTGPSPSPPSSP